MSQNTSIEWTDATWNPVTGCTKVSAGCKNCYAERVFSRVYSKHRVPVVDNGCDSDPARDEHFRPRQFTDVRCHPERLKQPLHWKKPRRIFVNSMSDLFHEEVPFEFIDKVFAAMVLCQEHTFQILTKRQERMREYISSNRQSFIAEAADQSGCSLNDWYTKVVGIHKDKWPLPNVCLGVSVEDQTTADERIPLLLQTPAAVRFVSYEPALGPIDLAAIKIPSVKFAEKYLGPCGKLTHGRINWMIVGGESGPGARPFNVQWARDVIQQCKAAAVPVFVKQLGRVAIEEFAPQCDHFLNLSNRKGGDPAEWPEDLRIREFPHVQ